MDIKVNRDNSGNITSAEFYCPCEEHQSEAHYMIIPTRHGIHKSVTAVETKNVGWEITQHEDGTVTLHPSIQVIGACGAHFFIKRSEVHWCGRTIK